MCDGGFDCSTYKFTSCCPAMFISSAMWILCAILYLSNHSSSMPTPRKKRRHRSNDSAYFLSVAEEILDLFSRMLQEIATTRCGSGNITKFWCVWLGRKLWKVSVRFALLMWKSLDSISAITFEEPLVCCGYNTESFSNSLVTSHLATLSWMGWLFL